MSAPDLAAWTVFFLGSALAIHSAFTAWREYRLLRGVVRELCPSGRFERREDLVVLKNFLNARIVADPAKKFARRPLLRDSASRTLKTGSGYCGENARVAILLLALGGVRAHRFYIQGPRWGHVVVEHAWQGGWRLFDGHADPATRFGDDDVARFSPQEFPSLPSTFRDTHPWLRAYRVKLLHLVPPLRRFSGPRLPRAVILIGECPALLRGSAAVTAMTAAAAWLVASR